MSEPTTGTQIQHCFRSIQWIKTGIPEFSLLTQQLKCFCNWVTPARTRERNVSSLVSISKALVGEILNWRLFTTSNTPFIDVSHALTATYRNFSVSTQTPRIRSDSQLWCKLRYEPKSHLIPNRVTNLLSSFLVNSWIKTFYFLCCSKKVTSLLLVPKLIQWIAANPDGFCFLMFHKNLI